MLFQLFNLLPSSFTGISLGFVPNSVPYSLLPDWHHNSDILTLLSEPPHHRGAVIRELAPFATIPTEQEAQFLLWFMTSFCFLSCKQFTSASKLHLTPQFFQFLCFCLFPSSDFLFWIFLHTFISTDIMHIFLMKCRKTTQILKNIGTL